MKVDASVTIFLHGIYPAQKPWDMKDSGWINFNIIQWKWIWAKWFNNKASQNLQSLLYN